MFFTKDIVTENSFLCLHIVVSFSLRTKQLKMEVHTVKIGSDGDLEKFLKPTSKTIELHKYNP